jgi:ATP-binding cassette subfamily C protein CydCD
VVGPSGAGKSTIARLLLRQHDVQTGVVRIGGSDIRTLDPEQVRGMIAIVAQETTLFAGTIADNLLLGRPDAREADMIGAARATNAHAVILALTNGYSTRVGERGATLSGGHASASHRPCAAARCDPDLDEALSSVDAENEAVINRPRRLMQGRTTLILAHRLSSVIGANRILVLDQGRVVQSGTHAELITQPGVYRRLMEPQLSAGGKRPASVERVEITTSTATPEVRGLTEDAAEVSWADTLHGLLHVIGPWRAQFALTILCGVARVAAFIGVSVLGALVIAAVTSGR